MNYLSVDYHFAYVFPQNLPRLIISLSLSASTSKSNLLHFHYKAIQTSIDFQAIRPRIHTSNKSTQQDIARGVPSITDGTTCVKFSRLTTCTLSVSSICESLRQSPKGWTYAEEKYLTCSVRSSTRSSLDRLKYNRAMRWSITERKRGEFTARRERR